MNEMGLFDVFQEINSIEPEQRDSAFEDGSKNIDYVLVIEGVLRCITWIELIECSEITELDHQGYLIW